MTRRDPCREDQLRPACIRNRCNAAFSPFVRLLIVWTLGSTEVLRHNSVQLGKGSRHPVQTAVNLGESRGGIILEALDWPLDYAEGSM